MPGDVGVKHGPALSRPGPIVGDMPSAPCTVHRHRTTVLDSIDRELSRPVGSRRPSGPRAHGGRGLVLAFEGSRARAASCPAQLLQPLVTDAEVVAHFV